MTPLLKILLSLAITSSLASVAMAEQKLMFAHDNKADPFDNPAHACTAVFANIVNADTNQEIQVEVFPSNELGTAKEHVQLVRDGIVQATLASTGALSSYYPRIDILNLPFAFNSNASTYQVFDGPFGKMLARDIEKTLGDVVVLGFPDTGGFFAITNSKRKISELKDFDQVRIRTMTLPSHQEIIESLGGEAYPLEWGAVYSGLQTGIIDGQMNPIPTISFSEFSKVQKYLTLTNHLFSPYTLMVGKDFFDGLTEAQQGILRYAAASCVTASRGLSRVIEASDRGLAGLKDKIEITALNDEQRAQMADVSQPAFEKYITRNLDERAIELLKVFEGEVTRANESSYLE